MRSYFTSLKACIEKYSEIRYEEGKIEHQFHELLNERPELSESNTTSLLKSVGESNKKLYELAMNNKTELENKLFFDTESHLVWIESVIDLLQRRRELKDRLSFIDKKLQDQNDQSVQYDFANEQINLIGRCKKLTTGVIQEVDLLKKGTNEFFKDKLWKEFFTCQQIYIDKCFKQYEKVQVNPSMMDKSTIDEELDRKFERNRGISFTNKNDYEYEYQSPPQHENYNNRHDDYDDDDEFLDTD